MDLIRELGPSGSDNDDEEQEDGLIIIPPQRHTPDSPNVGKIVHSRGSTFSSDAKDPTKSTLFRQSVKNKLKAYTEGKVSLPGSPIPSKSKKEQRKLTKEEDSIDENGTLVDRDKKLRDNSPTVKGVSPIVSAAILENVDTVGQSDVPIKRNIHDEFIQDVELREADFSKSSKNSPVPRTNSIEKLESKIRKIKNCQSWIEIKENDIDLESIRNHLDNPLNTNQGITYDFRQQLLFKSPANFLNGLTCKGAENKPNQRIAPQFLRFTITHPEIAWSCNLLINPTLTRSEILQYIPPNQKGALEKLIESKEPLKSTDKKLYNKWYTKLPLLACETENSNNEPLRLSFINNTSDGEVREDELTPKIPENLSKFVDANIFLKSGKKRKKKKHSRSSTEDEVFSKKKRSKKNKKDKKHKSKSKHSKSSEKQQTKKVKYAATSPNDYLEVPIEAEKPKKKGKYDDILFQEYLEAPVQPQKRKKKKSNYIDVLSEDYLEVPNELKKPKKRNEKHTDISRDDYLEAVSETDMFEKKKEKYVDLLPGDYLEAPVLDSKRPRKHSKASQFLESKEKLNKHSSDHHKSLSKDQIDKNRKHSSTKSRSKSHEDQPRKDSSKSKSIEGEDKEESHTPRTEEYHSRWESDEELLKLERHAKKKYKHQKGSSKNMSWESDDENHSRQKYSSHHHHHRVPAERSLEMPLEMPLNIMHVSRHRTSPKYDEGRHRKEQAFYSEDSWERGEYLKIKNELDNIELQKGRQSLSEERRLLEIEKRKIAEMEQRLAEQRFKQLQQQEVVAIKEPRHSESKEKRYFENIGKEATREENESFVCEYHKSIIDSKQQRKSRWETPKEESDHSLSVQLENYSPSPRPVSTSPFPFHKSPIAIDVDNYSPKVKASTPEATPVPIEVDEEPTIKDMLEDIQLPTSTSSSLQPVGTQNIEKVVKLENEYEQFMMSLENANETEDVQEELKVEEVAEDIVKAKKKKSTPSSSSEATSDSSSGTTDSSEASSSSTHEEVKKELTIVADDHKEPQIIKSIVKIPEKPSTPNMRLVTNANNNKPSIINQRPSISNRPMLARPRVPITILETIIIEDDDVPIKQANVTEVDLSKIELPPQFTAPIVMEVPLNLIELPPTINMDITPENIPDLVEEPPESTHPIVDTLVEVLPPASPLPAVEETPTVAPPDPPVEVVPNIIETPDVPETPKEETGLKRNNLISIKFLSPRKRALEMNTSMTEEVSDGEEEKKQLDDSTANTKRLFTSLNEPSSPRNLKLADTIKLIDTRPQLITFEEKLKLDQMRKDTLERNEMWLLEKSGKAFKDLRELITSKDPIKEADPSDHHKDRERSRDKDRDKPASSVSSDRQRKDSTSSDRQRKDSGERKKSSDANKRRPSSKERDFGQRRRSVSPSSKRRRMSPPSKFDRERNRERDRDKDRQRRPSPRRNEKERDRRLDGKGRRSRSRSPVKGKSVDRRRSRDKSPKRKSGDRERDRRDSRRVSPPRSRRRSPSPSSKRRSGHRERSRSPDRGKKERIEDTLKRLAGIDQYHSSTTSIHHSTTSTSNPINKSPRSSPLDGFKRSLADSTISDDQLIPTISESPVKQSPKTDYYKTTTGAYHSSSTTHYGHTKHDTNAKPKLSPKRPSLDDRINQVLGIEKSEADLEAPRRISTTYEGQYDYGNKYPVYAHQHPDYRSGYSAAVAGEMKADDGSRLVQMGNVLQIVPAASSDGDTSRLRKDHPSSSHHLHHQSHHGHTTIPSHHHPPTPQQQILQVGNMLQIVPTALPTVQTSSSAAAVAAVLAAVAPPPPPPLLPAPETVQEKVLSSAEELLRQQHAQRKAEKEVRRQERDRRRKEKERKQKEREKKKALRVKTKTEDMIKRALMLETEGNVEEDASETAVVAEEMEEEIKWSPSNPILAGALANLAKPVGKSILTSEKLSKLNVTKALELLTESRKQVKFADGIIPGEGTSPSAGEELSSPPPSGKRAAKERRHSKSLLSKAVRNKLSKKKVKVKVVRNSKKHSTSTTASSRNPTNPLCNPSSNPPNPNLSQPSPSPSDADLEQLPPPSPPPGSPPPHIFPARVKPPPPPNNIHPTAVAAYLPPGATHYPYAASMQQPQVQQQVMYGVAPGAVVGVVGGQMMGVAVGGYAAPPPPPPPPPPAAGSGGSGRYGGIPALPPTHQLPHHLALRAGVSHKRDRKSVV